MGCVVQGSDRGRKHAVQKGVCVHVCVCRGGRGGEGVIERERGEGKGRVGAEQESVYVWRGYGEGAEGGGCVYLQRVEEKWEGRRVLHKEKQGC